MYEVIHFFTDLQDNGHAYRVGETYPRRGLSVTEARIKELSGTYNKQRVPLIKLVKEKAAEKVVPVKEEKTEKPENTKTYTKTEIYRMNKDELVSLATEKGIDDAANMSVADLKTKILETL